MADLKPYPLEHHCLCQPLIEEVDGLYKYSEKIYAECVDLTNEAICRAVIRAARENGVTQIYLLDKQFVEKALSDALEKWRRDNVDRMSQMPRG